MKSLQAMLFLHLPLTISFKPVGSLSGFDYCSVGFMLIQDSLQLAGAAI